MNWDDKVKMVKSLNNGNYKDAVEMMSIEQDWDDQCVDMFVTGFDLTQCHFLIPIKDRICQAGANNLRVALRLSAIQAWFDNHGEDE